MTYQKTCEYCGDHFEAKRQHARYCSEPCSTQGWVEEQVYGPQRSPERVTSGAHPLDDVRGLLEEYKGDWTAIIREHARRTLLATGFLSAPDFDALGVPAEHCNIPGAQIGAFASAGYMEAVTFKRWSAEAKASRKSGKYWIYRITEKGKEKLAGPTADSSSSSEKTGSNRTQARVSGRSGETKGGDGTAGTREVRGGLSVAEAPSSGAGGASKTSTLVGSSAAPSSGPLSSAASGESGPNQTAAVDTGQSPDKRDSGRSASVPAGVDQPEPLSLLPDVEPKRPRSAFTDGEWDAAA